MARGKPKAKKATLRKGYESVVMYGKSLYTIQETGNKFTRYTMTKRGNKRTNYKEIKLGNEKLYLSENLFNVSVNQLRETVTKMAEGEIGKKAGIEQLRKIKGMMRNASETYRVDKFFYNLAKDSGIGDYFNKPVFKGHFNQQQKEMIKQLGEELSTLTPQEKVDFYNKNKAFFDDITKFYEHTKKEGDVTVDSGTEFSVQNFMITVENLLTKVLDYKS